MGDGKLRILYVEDDEGEVLLLKETLSQIEAFRYQLCNAPTLKQSLELLDNESFDIILLDLGLPDSLGLETFRRVYNYNGEIAIIILTGNDDSYTALKAIQMGAQDFLIKGRFTPEVLNRAIKYSIERKKSEREILKREEQLRRVIDTNSDAMIIVDKAGYIVFANPAAGILFGKDISEIINTQFGFSLDIKKQEIDIQQPFGNTLIGEYRCVSIIWEDKECYLASIRDITELKRIEQELREHRNNLEQKVKERTAELEIKNEELENDYRLMVGREFRIKELRDEVARLEKELKLRDSLDNDREL